MEYQKIIQKLNCYQRIVKEISDGNANHAYLLKSEDKELSFEVALMLAANILCDKKPACEECRKCRNVYSLRHPDVFVYPKKKETLLTEDIAEIISNCYLVGMEGDEKVFILKNTSSAQETVQNKLLKILEEPPKGVHFILLCESEDALLLTIRSRVYLIEVERLSKIQVMEYLQEKYQDDDRLQIVADSCDGMVSRARQMLTDKNYFLIYNNMFEVMNNFNHSSQILEKSKLFAKCDTEVSLYILMQVLSDVLQYKISPTLVKNVVKMEIIKNVAANYPQAALIGAIEKVDMAKKKLDASCNLMQLIDGLLIGILEVRGKCLI